MTDNLPRAEAVKKLTKRIRLADPHKDSFWAELSRRIRDGKVIPIISNSFWLEHVFHGLLTTEDSSKADCQSFGAKILNIDDYLSQAWAEEISYPLLDSCELARVAQYNRVRAEDDERAKVIYLNFLKNALLTFADNNKAPDDLLAELQGCLADSSFTDLARCLKYPQFPEGLKDPLQILADLPLPIYVTTSYHEFIEDALIRSGKQPVTQVCFWSGQVSNVDTQHEILKDYFPTVEKPLVYHLYGLERYPTTLVISEDDYLDFLTKITHDLDPEHPIVPLYLRSALSTSSLIMLGYRMWEWDFRILFRASVKALPGSSNWFSLIIQLTPEQQYQIQDKDEARRYLETYFSPAHFKVEWTKTDGFLYKLWEEWNKWRLGQ